MKRVITAVRDRAADSFGQPIFTASIGQAIRAFSDEINRQAPPQENALFAHPEDFDLYELGSFDDGDGSFELLDKPRQVAIGKDVFRGGGHA